MPGRRTRVAESADHSRRFHNVRVADAKSRPRRELWEMCRWLVAEAVRTGSCGEMAREVKQLITRMQGRQTVR